MEPTRDNIEKLAREVVDQMDFNTMKEIVYDRIYHYYANECCQSDFDEEWEMTFGERNEE